jgi:hypothetical protein
MRVLARVRVQMDKDRGQGSEGKKGTLDRAGWKFRQLLKKGVVLELAKREPGRVPGE